MATTFAHLLALLASQEQNLQPKSAGKGSGAERPTTKSQGYAVCATLGIIGGLVAVGLTFKNARDRRLLDLCHAA